MKRGDRSGDDVAKKSIGPVVESRIADVIELIVTGHTRADVIAYAEQEGWKVCVRQIEKYLTAAYQAIRESSIFDREAEIGKAVKRFDKIFRIAMSMKNFAGKPSPRLRDAIAAQKELIELFGLAAPKKISVEGDVRTKTEGKHRLNIAGLTNEQIKNFIDIARTAKARADARTGPAKKPADRARHRS